MNHATGSITVRGAEGGARNESGPIRGRRFPSLGLVGSGLPGTWSGYDTFFARHVGLDMALVRPSSCRPRLRLLYSQTIVPQGPLVDPASRVTARQVVSSHGVRRGEMSTRDAASLTVGERAALTSLEAMAVAEDPQLARQLRGSSRLRGVPDPSTQDSGLVPEQLVGRAHSRWSG